MKHKQTLLCSCYGNIGKTSFFFEFAFIHYRLGTREYELVKI